MRVIHDNLRSSSNLSDFDENVEVWILRKGANELLVDVGDAVEEKALAKAAQDGNVALPIFATHFVTLLNIFRCISE